MLQLPRSLLAILKKNPALNDAHAPYLPAYPIAHLGNVLKMLCRASHCIVTTSTLIGLLSCTGKLQPTVSYPAAASGAKISNIVPAIARPGDIVTVSGEGFKTGMMIQFAAKMNPITLDLQVVSATSATFIAPDKSTGPGIFPAHLMVGSHAIGSAIAFGLNVGGELPLASVNPDLVCSGTLYRNASGLIVEGTQSCGEGKMQKCRSDGETGCLATSGFPAADVTNVAAKLRAGSTIAGVDGTIADCAVAGGEGCLATATYRAYDLSGLVPGDLKIGKHFGSIEGSMRDTKHCLNGKGVTKMGGDNSIFWDGFEYFGGNSSFPYPAAAGAALSTTAGTASLTATGFDLTTLARIGDYVRVGSDVRQIVNVAAGQLDVDQNFTATMSIGSGVSSSSTFGFRPLLATGNTDDQQCCSVFFYRGSEITNCNGSDITDVSGQTDSIPDSSKNAGWNKVYYVSSLGLWITNSIGTLNWYASLAACKALSGGTGGNGWRLPHQKEVMQLYINGVGFSIVTGMGWLWTDTTASGNNTAFRTYLVGGAVDYVEKSSAQGVFCVR